MTAEQAEAILEQVLTVRQRSGALPKNLAEVMSDAAMLLFSIDKQLRRIADAVEGKQDGDMRAVPPPPPPPPPYPRRRRPGEQQP